MCAPCRPRPTSLARRGQVAGPAFKLGLSIARNRATLQMERLLGRGKYSQVFLARDRKTGQLVAIKRVRPARTGALGSPLGACRTVWEAVCPTARATGVKGAVCCGVRASVLRWYHSVARAVVPAR